MPDGSNVNTNDENAANTSAVPPTALTSLQRSAVRGSAFSVTNQAVKLTTHILTLLVAAFYLEKEQVGLWAVAFSIQTLILLVRDSGLANSIIQAKVITDKHLNSVLWLGLGLSVFLAGGLALLAKSLASFMGKEQLAPMLWVMAIPIVAQAFGSVQETQLRKELRFGRLLLADSGSAVLASVACVIALALGAGIWGLVLRMVAAPLLLAIACWLMSPWRPKLEFDMGCVKSLWSFGAYFFLTALLGYGMTRLDVVLLGKLLGFTAAGVFFMARNLALSPIQESVNAVGRVMFPVFSALQGDKASIASGYLSATRCLAAIFFPIIAALLAIAPELEAVVLPAEWSGTAIIIQIISVQGLIICLNNPASQVLYARGRSRLQFVYSLIIGVFVISAFVVGCRWGVVGVAVTWTVVQFCGAPVVLYYACREVEMKMTRVMLNVSGPALAAALAGCAAELVASVWAARGYSVGPMVLGLEVLAGLTVYLLMSRLLFRETIEKLRRDFGAALGRSRDS